MKTRATHTPGEGAFETFDEQVRRAMLEDGAIIPENIEEVRRVKVRLEKQPLTLPPHLRSSSAIAAKGEGELLEDKIVVLADHRAAAEDASPSSHRQAPRATEEFVEAVLIAQITRVMTDSQHPLGHLRQNKFMYFAHRKAEEDVGTHFMKKAAGPYSPWATYKGPETIAQRNKYLKKAKVGKFFGFIVAENIDKIDQYVSRYPVCAAVSWVKQHFQFKRNEDLELFATVDFAALDLVQQRTDITVENVKRILDTNSEWKPKLKREIFSDANITRALAELRLLFPATYA